VDAALLAELQRRYAEPHRHAHCWPRVSAMLAEAEEVAQAIAERPPFVLAVLFHRAVFDRRIGNGGEQSAKLMRRLLQGAPERLLARAEALIMAVQRQELPETDDPSLRGDAALLLDMDRAVLGAPAATFAAHEAAYRAEYAHLVDDAYAAGRSAELRLLLWRERIFLTDRYYLEHERRARRNITGLLERLGG
jgi:predicted metal-dependent HD superfamily phosphohydrolase